MSEHDYTPTELDCAYSVPIHCRVYSNPFCTSCLENEVLLVRVRSRDWKRALNSEQTIACALRVNNGAAQAREMRLRPKSSESRCELTILVCTVQYIVVYNVLLVFVCSHSSKEMFTVHELEMPINASSELNTAINCKLANVKHSIAHWLKWEIKVARTDYLRDMNYHVAFARFVHIILNTLSQSVRTGIMCFIVLYECTNNLALTTFRTSSIMQWTNELGKWYCEFNFNCHYHYHNFISRLRRQSSNFRIIAYWFRLNKIEMCLNSTV